MDWDPCQFIFRPDRTFVTFLGNLSWLKQTLRFYRKLIQLLGNFFAILGISGYKISLTLVSPGHFGTLSCIGDLLGIYYLSVKIWPCSLWVEVFVNLAIYFLVWPAFCHGNIGKFCLKPYPNYINFWNTKTVLCKLSGK